MLIVLLLLTAPAQAQSRGVERTHQSRPSDMSGTMRTPGSLSEPRFSPPDSHIPARSPDLGSATIPLSLPQLGLDQACLGQSLAVVRPDCDLKPRLEGGGQQSAAVDARATSHFTGSGEVCLNHDGRSCA